MTVQERFLAHVDSTKLVEKAKKIQALHINLFPEGTPRAPEGTPQIREELSHLFPYPTLEEIAAKNKPSPSIEESLEKSKSLLGIVGKMEAERRAEERREYDEKTRPFMKVVKQLNLEQRRMAAQARPIHAKYGKNGRLEGCK